MPSNLRKGGVHCVPNKGANSSPYTSHGTDSNAYIGKLADGLVFCRLLGYVKAAFLLVSVSFLHPFLGHGLRFNHYLLRIRLLINYANLLA